MSEHTAIQSRTIDVITAEICFYKQRAGRAILEIGHCLIEAKSQLKHGDWLPWLKQAVGFSEVTAQRFMRLAQEYENPSALTDLGATKAFALLALPASEREEFVRENNVEDLSTRELDRLIRERDEARKEAAAAEELKRKAELESSDLTTRNNSLHKEIEDLEDSRIAANAEAEALRKELEELRARPVDVAVQAADPAELEAAKKEAAAAAKKEAEAALKKKIEAADKKRQEAEDQLKKAKEAQKAAEAKTASAEQQAQAAQEQLTRERQEAEARMAALGKQLQASGNATVQTYKVYFEGTQGYVNGMTGCLKKLELAGDAETHNKLRDALLALAKSIQDNAPARMEQKAG